MRVRFCGWLTGERAERLLRLLERAGLQQRVGQLQSRGDGRRREGEGVPEERRCLLVVRQPFFDHARQIEPLEASLEPTHVRVHGRGGLPLLPGVEQHADTGRGGRVLRMRPRFGQRACNRLA